MVTERTIASVTCGLLFLYNFNPESEWSVYYATLYTAYDIIEWLRTLTLSCCYSWNNKPHDTMRKSIHCSSIVSNVCVKKSFAMNAVSTIKSRLCLCVYVVDSREVTDGVCVDSTTEKHCLSPGTGSVATPFVTSRMLSLLPRVSLSSH